jgi:hypothetical protein
MLAPAISEGDSAMGKTIKKIPYGIFRAPKGYVKALVEGVRKAAVPPNAYDDIQHDRQVWQPQHAAREMVKKGMADEEIIRRLRHKWRITQAQAEDLLKWLR